jgi:hypothetical protein
VTHCLVSHHITGHLMFVLVSTEQVMMCPPFGNPVSCEISAVIRFLRAKCMRVVEFHREVRAVYGQHATSEGTLRQWCRMFKDGRANKGSR